MAVKRRPRTDEDEQAEERPARRRPRDDDEDEAPRPTRRAARDEPEDDDEEPKRSRRSRPADDEDEDGDDAPVGKRGSGSVRKGWDGHKANKAKGSDYADEFKVETDAHLIKFLEDEPFVSYRQHWVDNPPNGIKKKSWTCLEDNCPLCDLGDRPRLLTGFNILHISTGADPENKAMFLGVKATGQVENFAADDKTGPLTKHYWSVSKSGKNQQTAYNFRPVKERDLDEDWDTDPLTEDDIEDALANLYDESIVQIPLRKQLKEIAGGLLEDDEDD